MDVKKVESGRIIAFKPRQTETPSHAKQTQQAPQKSVEPLVIPNNPQYYQAINNINFANQYVAIPSFNSSGAINLLRLHILFDEEDSVTLDIDKNDSVELFLNSEGKLDKKTVDFFVEYYTLFFQIRKKRYEKTKKELIEIINEKPKSNLRVINQQKDVERAIEKNEDTQPDEYIKSLVSDIVDCETRRDYAIMYLNRIEAEFAKSSITTAQEALCLLKLCKKDDEIDTTNFDIKNQIAVLAANYCDTVQQNQMSAILNSAKDKDGTIDLDVCLATLKLLIAGTEVEAPLLEIEIASAAVKKYKNEINFEEIIKDLEKGLQEGKLSLICLL
jgi:hypothetical protein